MTDIEEIHPWGHVTGDLGLVLKYEGLEQPSNAVKIAFNRFGTEFQSNVMQYTVESEIQYDLLSRLKRRLNPSPVRSFGRVVSIPDQYKAPYARGFTRGVQSDAIHAEVNIGTSSEFEINNTSDNSNAGGVEGLFEIPYKETNSVRLDIAQLRPQHHPLFDTDSELSAETNEYWRLSGTNGRPSDAVEVAISNGSKFFPPGAIRRAVEVKYIKDMSTPEGYTSPLDGDRSLSDCDESELTFEDLNVPWNKVDSDVEKLSKVRQKAQQVDCEPPPAHLVIVTNYDPFRLAPHRSDDEEESKGRMDESRVNTAYPIQFQKLVKTCAVLGIHVWVYHPTKIYNTDSQSST